MGVVHQGKRYPGDTSGVQGYKKKDADNGGGSDADWELTLRIGVDVYVMNKQDEVWRLPAYTPPPDRKKDKSQRRKQWRHNTNPSCDW
jgi:hypothetical protein